MAVVEEVRTLINGLRNPPLHLDEIVLANVLIDWKWLRRNNKGLGVFLSLSPQFRSQSFTLLPSIFLPLLTTCFPPVWKYTWTLY